MNEHQSQQPAAACEVPNHGVPRIVVVGSLNMDLVATVSRLPRPGETLSGSAFAQHPGGKGANQAVAAARLGASTTMLGRVGNDTFGQQLLRSLAASGVDVAQVHSLTNTPSGVALITVDAVGENTIAVIPGANGQLSPTDIGTSESILKTADVILVQLEIPLETVAATIALARLHNVRVVLDPAPAPADLPADLWQVDVLCPNRAEAQQLTGLTIKSLADAKRAVTRLTGQARLPIITLGDQGAVYWDAGQVRHVKSFPVQAVDTTAAGDAFAAALAVAIVEGQEPHAAVPFACAAGAIAASRPGAQPAMPSRHEVATLLAGGIRRELQ